MTLNELRVGQQATIVDVVGTDGISSRLMEMGLTDGETITLVGFAPLGDPIEFLIRGYRLSLRKAEASRVLITCDGHIPVPPQSS
ncbi:FeoA family protein [Schlesneria paludicola]|uniref:FeoA family protein n=1 Tax=Schlesneria paludicola TaxID=360056 RepID=UPI00029A8A05|nr:ferrous iron transport protein A [Schlesneria paludicola]